SGSLPINLLEVQSKTGVQKVPWADVSFVQFGDTDFVRTRRGKVVKGAIRVDGWTLKDTDQERPLDKAELRFVIPQISLGAARKGVITDAATANGLMYHVRLPERYDPKAGGAAIVFLHGSNANSADYL